MTILEAPSPNFGPRRGGVAPDMVVLHHTAMASAGAALDRLRDPAAQVSAHYLIETGGTVWRLVPEESRAWHAGVAAWGGVRDVNSHSVGIELANPAGADAMPPFPEPQMAALEALLDAVLTRWSIPPARVLAHSDVAPGRKADPGPKFDWRRLARGGRAVWPEAPDAAGVAPEAFHAAAGRAGYSAPGGDRAAVLAAFRLRFRPAARGAAPDAVDAALALALAERWPCVDPVLHPA